MGDAISMLRNERGVLTPRLLPYAPMLPTLAAAWAEVRAATGAGVGARKLKLQRWFGVRRLQASTTVQRTLKLQVMCRPFESG